MTREYTGAEFEIEFARAWLKFVEGGKVGVDPRTQWQSRLYADLTWYGSGSTPPNYLSENLYRWKPIPKRMVTIGYQNSLKCWCTKELVASEVEAPKNKSVFYTITNPIEQPAMWDGGEICQRWLKEGSVFLTREDATAMAEWLAVCRKGGSV